MVVHHWSDNGMVMNHRWSLQPSLRETKSRFATSPDPVCLAASLSLTVNWLDKTSHWFSNTTCQNLTTFQICSFASIFKVPSAVPLYLYLVFFLLKYCCHVNLSEEWLLCWPSATHFFRCASISWVGYVGSLTEPGRQFFGLLRVTDRNQSLIKQDIWSNETYRLTTLQPYNLTTLQPYNLTTFKTIRPPYQQTLDHQTIELSDKKTKRQKTNKEEYTKQRTDKYLSKMDSSQISHQIYNYDIFDSSQISHQI